MLNRFFEFLVFGDDGRLELFRFGAEIGRLLLEIVALFEPVGRQILGRRLDLAQFRLFLFELISFAAGEVRSKEREKDKEKRERKKETNRDKCLHGPCDRT